MSVNKNILELLKTSGITQAELADKLSIAPQSLSRMLKGNDLKVATLIEIAKALGVSPAHLIDPSTEVLIQSYRDITNELVQVLIGIIDDYTVFTNTLESICNKHPKIKNELNKIFSEINDKHSDKLAINAKNIYSDLPERSKRLHDIIDKGKEPKIKKKTELIKKGTTDEILKQLEEIMKRSSWLFKEITYADEKFDTTNVEILYEYYIHSKK